MMAAVPMAAEAASEANEVPPRRVVFPQLRRHRANLEAVNALWFAISS